MAGQLVQVATETVTSAVASVTLTGIDSDDVYMVALNNVTPATDNRNLLIRVTESGTPNTTANYDESAKFLDSTTTFGTQSNVNQAQWTNSLAIGNSTSDQTNGILYLYNVIIHLIGKLQQQIGQMLFCYPKFKMYCGIFC